MLTSIRTTNLLLVLVLAVGIAIVAMLASGVRGGPLDPPGAPGETAGVRRPGTPIAGPTTISSSGFYYLTSNLNSPNGIAITINADDVTLDLGGFVVDGADAVGSWGIYLNGNRRNVHITNGTVRDFQFGIDGGDDELMTIDDVRVTSNVRGIQIGYSSVVSECESTLNTETGIHITGDYSAIRGCSVVNNGADGITTPFGAEANIIEGSVVIGNSGADIRLLSHFNAVVQNVVFKTILQGINYMVDNVCNDGFIDEATPGTSYVPVAGTAHDNVQCTKS